MRCGRVCIYSQSLVYSEVKQQIKEAALGLVQRERDGEHVDRTLLKSVLDIFVEIGNGDLSCYEADFEEALLKVRVSHSLHAPRLAQSCVSESRSHRRLFQN